MSINSDISDIFSKIASCLEILDENVFKIRAYKKASKVVSEYPDDLNILIKNKEDLTNIPGIGKDLAQKILEYHNTKQVEYYEKLKKEVPPELIEILNVQGVGPKFLSLLFKQFGVRDIVSFESTLNNDQLLEVKGIGKKKIDEIKKGLEYFKQGKNRINIYLALSIADKIKKEIENIPGTKHTTFAGSLRRKKETIGDIDILTQAENTSEIVDKFTKLPIVKKTLASGKTKGSIIVEKGVQVDLRVVKPESYGAALQYFTGSKLHNVKLRTIASKDGFKINEYGLYKNDELIAGKKEEDIYRKLKLDYIQPELREDRGEIEAALRYELPELVLLKDIKGDLHTHSTWSDGKSSIEEMVEKAILLGYEYIAITDHSISSRIANGLSVDRLHKKISALKKINSKFKEIEILMGTEVDILKDGSLDYEDHILKELDFIVASVHSNFKMEESEMTGRICRALENPYVHVLGHPTGRLIGEREAYRLDIDKIIKTAKSNNKALEINSSFKRLDLNDLNVKKAVDNGVMLIISTDAHNTDQLDQMSLGVGVARRGWAEKKNILNTFTYNKLRKWLNSFK